MDMATFAITALKWLCTLMHSQNGFWRHQRTAEAKEGHNPTRMVKKQIANCTHQTLGQFQHIGEIPATPVWALPPPPTTTHHPLLALTIKLTICTIYRPEITSLKPKPAIWHHYMATKSAAVNMKWEVVGVMLMWRPIELPMERYFVTTTW